MAKFEICMGIFTKAHGIKGELCFDLYADSPSLLAGPAELERPNGTRIPAKVLSSRKHKNFWILSLAGVEDRDKAQSLAGSTFWIPRSTLPETAENEAYLSDLMGKEVALKDGTLVGKLHHIELPAGQLLWAIRDESSEMLFPAREEFIVSFGERIIINPPEGLLEACKETLK